MPACGKVPRNPFMLIGQMTTADATRSPSGTESMWAYTHLPRGTKPDDVTAQVARIGLGEASRLCARFVAATKERPGGLSLLADDSAGPPSPAEVAELFRNFGKYAHMEGFRRLVSLL